MKCLLLNDCSAYHVGSREVTKNIVACAKVAGIEVEIWKQLEAVPRGNYDVVVINGEGTFHHNAPRAFKLCQIANELKTRGARVYLINSLAHNIDIDFSVFDYVSVRETNSAAFIRRICPSQVVNITPDIAFLTKLPEHLSGQRSNVLFLDSVVSRYSKMLEFMAAALGTRFIRMTEWSGSFASLSSLMRSYALVITGRFHGAVMAMMTSTPFYAMPSNSWKTVGMLNDFGAGNLYLEDEASLRSALQKSPPAAVPINIDEISRSWRTVFSLIAGISLETFEQRMRGTETYIADLKQE
jgi:hypothetical protein